MNYLPHKINLKKILIGIFLMTLPMACDGGGDNNGDGGNNNDPFVSVCDGFIVTITGTEGDDNLVGTEGNDVIRGLGGNDTIDGRGGNDRICGDRGNDNLLGGNGNDILDGGPDDDIVDGESGDDIIIEAPGSHDVLVGPAFNPQGPQNLDEVSYTDAISGIFMNITSNENQVVNEDGDTVRIDGFFPNIYGSFHPDSFFFSNEFHDGAEGHVFDPIQGGNDILIIDAAGMPISVIKETSFFQGALGPLQGDTTILIGNTLLNTVDIEVITAYNFPPLIIDDGDPHYSAPGFTNQAVGGQGFNRDIDFSPAGEGNTATWSFIDLPNGTYHISTTWDPSEDRATNSPFTIADGLAPLNVLINQELAPDDFQDSGVSWETLGLINVTSNKLTVTLNDDANEFVIADAVRIERVPIDAELTIDNEKGILQDDGFPNFEFPNIEGTLDEDNGWLGGQIFIEDLFGSDLDINSAIFNQGFNQKLVQVMVAKNTNMFLVSTTYVPDAGATNQAEFTINLNGNPFTASVDQTTIINDFDIANGTTQFQNLFLCIVPNVTEAGDITISLEISSADNKPAIFDAVGFVPVNLLEISLFNDTALSLDFDGDQMCIIVP
ncbi:MAG: hypothetical protein O6702_04620 [Candidatus Dadabacteria bacterium]|nr:hypothetical protein [Candidatus Dadabacteria bacterium]